jgi:signal transduction histidine kinase
LRQGGVPIRFEAKDVPAPVPGDVSLCLYRVAQESLRNIAKHSGALEVRVRLEGVPGGIRMRIEDVGDGFDLQEARRKGGLGLVSMEERARLVNGKLSIQSQPGKGTTVEVFVPLGAES